MHDEACRAMSLVDGLCLLCKAPWPWLILADATAEACHSLKRTEFDGESSELFHQGLFLLLHPAGAELVHPHCFEHYS